MTQALYAHMNKKKILSFKNLCTNYQNWRFSIFLVFISQFYLKYSKYFSNIGHFHFLLNLPTDNLCPKFILSFHFSFLIIFHKILIY
jgi:hypothetical protein